MNPQNDAPSCRNNNNRKDSQNHEHYTHEYSENDYDGRNYDDTNGEQTQYDNYGYKENYYEMRNAYSSENLMNHVWISIDASFLYQRLTKDFIS